MGEILVRSNCGASSFFFFFSFYFFVFFSFSFSFKSTSRRLKFRKCSNHDRSRSRASSEQVARNFAHFCRETRSAARIAEPRMRARDEGSRLERTREKAHGFTSGSRPSMVSRVRFPYPRAPIPSPTPPLAAVVSRGSIGKRTVFVFVSRANERGAFLIFFFLFLFPFLSGKRDLVRRCVSSGVERVRVYVSVFPRVLRCFTRCDSRRVPARQPKERNEWENDLPHRVSSPPDRSPVPPPPAHRPTGYVLSLRVAPLVLDFNLITLHSI